MSKKEEISKIAQALANLAKKETEPYFEKGATNRDITHQQNLMKDNTWKGTHMLQNMTHTKWNKSYILPSITHRQTLTNKYNLL